METLRYYVSMPTPGKIAEKVAASPRRFIRSDRRFGTWGPPKTNMTIAGKSTMNESIRISHFMAGDFPAIVMLVFGSVTDFPVLFLVFGQKISIWLA